MAGALSLDVGTTIHIINNEALVNVKMVKNDVYTASIPYATIMVPDATQYTTHEEVTIEGQEGSQTCLDQVTYINGVETERTNVNRVVVAPAVNEVAIVGTITPPDGSIPEKPAVHLLGQYLASLRLAVALALVGGQLTKDWIFPMGILMDKLL